MTRHIGREMILSLDLGSGLDPVAGVQQKQLNFGAAGPDVTTDDDEGWQTLLDTPGVRFLNASLNGILEDHVIATQMLAASGFIVPASITLPTGATISGNFRIETMNLGASTPEGITFSIELKSSGEVTIA